MLNMVVKQPLKRFLLLGSFFLLPAALRRTTLSLIQIIQALSKKPWPLMV